MQYLRHSRKELLKYLCNGFHKLIILTPEKKYKEIAYTTLEGTIHLHKATYTTIPTKTQNFTNSNQLTCRLHPCSIQVVVIFLSLSGF